MQTTKIEREGKQLRTIVKPTQHFDLEQSLRFLDESGASDRLDQVDPSIPQLKRVMLLDDAPFMVTLEQVAEDALALSLLAPDAADPPEDNHLQVALNWATRRFWLDVEMAAVKEAIAVDAYGKMIVDAFWPRRPANYAGAWEALLISVVHAQIYPGLAQKLDDTLAEVYGPKAVIEGETYYLTPRPFDLLKAFEDELRGMKFSRQKADYLTSFPQTILDDAQTYDFAAMRERDGQAVIADFKQLRGVGDWTSQNVAMRGLPHKDVFIDEKALRAAIAPHYFRNEDEITKKNYQAAVAHFAPYRSFACYYSYMWHFGSERSTDDGKE